MPHTLTTPALDLPLASATEGVLANQALLTKLRDGEWLPREPQEIVAALRLLADQLSDVATPDLADDLAEPDPALGGIAARPAVKIGKDE
jgi:hypothetical protein